MDGLFDIQYVDLEAGRRDYKHLEKGKLCLYVQIGEDPKNKTYYIRMNRYDAAELVKEEVYHCKIGRVSITGDVLLVLNKKEGPEFRIDRNGGCLRLNSKAAVYALADLLDIYVDDNSKLHLQLDIKLVKKEDSFYVYKVTKP